MIVDRRLLSRWNDERGKGETAISRPVEEPHADTTPHPTSLERLLIPFRQPIVIREEFGEVRSDRGQDLVRIVRGCSYAVDLLDERPHSRYVEDVFSFGAWIIAH
jgi:hypothetical protein